MDTPKISLQAGDSGTNGYFSFRIKKQLTSEMSYFRESARIFIISDIEGNFSALLNLLMKNRIIDRNYQWICKETHLVILGDCFDKGEHVIECLWLIYSLEERAKREGGYIHFILGNHEIMNLNGDWRYVHPKYAHFTRSGTPLSALYQGNSELWCWLRTKNIIEKIGDTMFVHAGIAPELLLLNLTIAEINNLARCYYTRANEQFTDPLLYTILSSEQSPFWYRGYYKGSVTEEQIDIVLQYYDVRTIVTGHTVVEKVTPFFNGKVINVDTDHASGNSEALLIKNGKFYRVDKSGERERIK